MGIRELQAALGARAVADEPLARHVTFRIGGPAELWFEAETTQELVQALVLAREHRVPAIVLGNGSNVLVRDGGIRGLVIRNHSDHYQLDTTDPARAILHAESGVSLPLMANRLTRDGWSGLEWAIGIPGTLGGAVAGNAGAHGSCIADSVVAVSVLDETGAVRRLGKLECAFAYRASRFKRSRREIILAAECELVRADPVALIARMGGYAEQRRRTQPTDASVGSMFKNPPGDYAGRLIEQAGLKGVRVGAVQVSPLHANFFVNHGGATAREVIDLVELVRQRVYEEFTIDLELEIEVVGE